MLEVTEQIRAWTDAVAADATHRVTADDILERCAAPRTALTLRHQPGRRTRHLLVGAAAAIVVAGSLAAVVATRTGQEEVVADRPDATAQSGGSDAPRSGRLAAPTRDTTLRTPMGTTRLSCRGSGAVPVVMVTNAADPESHWQPLIDETGQETLLCTFSIDDDRSVPTTTDPPGGADASRKVASALASTLEKSPLPPPFVLVADGDAWATVAALETADPSLVGGVLLLDTTSTPDRILPATGTRTGHAPAVALAASPDPATQLDQAAIAGYFGTNLDIVASDASLTTAARPAPVYNAIDRLVLAADGN